MKALCLEIGFRPAMQLMLSAGYSGADFDQSCHCCFRPVMSLLLSTNQVTLLLLSFSHAGAAFGQPCFSYSSCFRPVMQLLLSANNVGATFSLSLSFRPVMQDLLSYNTTPWESSFFSAIILGFVCTAALWEFKCYKSKFNCMNK